MYIHARTPVFMPLCLMSQNSSVLGVHIFDYVFFPIYTPTLLLIYCLFSNLITTHSTLIYTYYKCDM